MTNEIIENDGVNVSPVVSNESASKSHPNLEK